MATDKTHDTIYSKQTAVPMRQDRDLLYSFGWAYGTLLFLELWIRALTSSAFWGVGLVYIALFSIPPALLIAGIRALCGGKAGFAVEGIGLGVFSVFYVVQLFYYYVFGTFLTLFSVLNGTQAFQFSDTILATLSRHWFALLCTLLPLLVYLAGASRKPQPRVPARALLSIALAIAIQFASIASLGLYGTGYLSPYDYYHHTRPLGQTVNKLGLLTTSRLDAQRLLLGDNEVLAEPALPGSEPTETPPAPAPTIYEDNVLDIDFAALAAAESDPTIQAMHQYFGSLSPTRQNEYTGLLDGYNLITITAEAFAPYAIDKELTPTLYKMQQEGMSFSNYYCPEWGVSTYDGEYANMLGLIPKQGVWSLYLTANYGNSVPFALGQRFGAMGYQTNAYHNHYYDYYSRDISHPHLGYTYKGLGNGLDVEEQWPESDLEMIDVSTGEYLNGKPFHTYYLTVSGHMNYSFDTNVMAAKNQHLVQDLDMSEQAKAYLACNIELDRAMELLLKRLEEAGQADNTLIVISPDHPPYGLERETIAELSGTNPDADFDYYKSILMMYSPSLPAQVMDKPCSSLDILPTLSNLFGLPYDSRLLMGQDILSDAEPLVIFANRSWITDKAMFDTETGAVTPLGGGDISDNYVERINRKVADKFAFSAAILDYDYYAYALPATVSSDKQKEN